MECAGGVARPRHQDAPHFHGGRLTHAAEGLQWFPSMRWGDEQSIGHYLDLSLFSVFTTDSEAVKRIHQVCCRLDDIAGSHRPA